MATLPKPNKPLNILTIDGGGLEVGSTLIILQQLLDAIARSNGVPDSKPRPCDVFDVIAGVGQGEWLALLFGRFQVDTIAALAELYNLIDCIRPRSVAEELCMCLLQHSHYNTDGLVELIDELTEFYETDKHMFSTLPEGTRCKHVFVSALKTDSKDRQLEYNLSRTYDCPKGSNVLEGPQSPHECKISDAFQATGAVKYFTPPWKEPTAKRGVFKCLDIQSLGPHNITELALNEMWGLYGKDVEISVVVNIGPGISDASNCKDIARRCPWATKATRSLALFTQKESFRSYWSHHHKSPDGMPHDSSGIPHQIKFDQNSQGPAGDIEKRTPVTRQTTFGLERDVGIEGKLRRDESKIKSDIREKLRNVYPEHTPPYYRLVSAPERSAPGTARKYTFPLKASLDYTKEYVRTPSAQAAMEEVGQRIDLGTSEHENA